MLFRLLPTSAARTVLGMVLMTMSFLANNSPHGDGMSTLGMATVTTLPVSALTCEYNSSFSVVLHLSCFTMFQNASF